MISKNIDPAILELVEQARGLGRTQAAVRLYEQAIAFADSLNDLESGYHFRIEMMNQAQFCGHPERVIAALAWCLQLSDDEPLRFNSREPLWQYKWLVVSLPEFHSVSPGTIDAALDDLSERFIRAGWGQHGPIKLRMSVALTMGDVAAAGGYYEAWCRQRRGSGSDCPACDADDVVRLLIAQHQPEAAIQAAGPLLRGKLRCAEMPQITYGRVLQPLMELGRIDDARKYHSLGAKVPVNDAQLLVTTTRHIEFLARAGQLDCATELLQRRLAVALEAPNPRERFYVYAAAARLMRRHLEAEHTGTALVLPAPLRDQQADDAESLAQYFEREAEALATKFDQRNGNSSFKSELSRPWPSLPN